jgi:hypothetical protein
MLNNTKKNLIFIENSEQVKLFTKYFKKNNFAEDYCVIAIGPSAQVALIKMNIPFIKSDEYFGNQGHIEVLQKATKIIDIMREDFFIIDSIGVNHAYEREFFGHFRYYYLNYCLSILTIIHNSISNLRPEKIILPASVKPSCIPSRMYPSISLLGLLAQSYAFEHKYKIVLEGEIVEPKVKVSNIKNYFIRIIFNIQLIMYKWVSSGKNVIWATNSSYNIPNVMEYLDKKIKSPFHVGGSNFNNAKLLLLFIIKRKYWKFYKFPPPTSAQKLNNFSSEYKKSVTQIEAKINDNIDCFSVSGVCLRTIIMDFLENGLKNHLKTTFFGAQAFNRILNIKKPTFLIANGASSYHYAIGELCRSNNIDAMLISHGTHVSHEELLPKAEWAEHARFMIASHYPLVSVQTPWAKQFLDDRVELVSKPIITGPLLYSKSRSEAETLRLRKSLFPKNYRKKIILHAASPFGWHVFHPFVNLTHDEYVRHINDLIQTTEKMDNVFLAIRIRTKSFYGMALEDIKTLFIKSDCYEIYTERSFDEYLLSSDLLVSFSSTTIEEALQLRVPVIQYDPFNRYMHIPAHKINQNSKLKVSPIYYVSELHDLLSSIDWIIKNHLDIKNSQEIIDWKPHIIDFSENWILPIVGDQNSL